MELKKYTFLTNTQIEIIQSFINDNSFNNEISFLENETNFYEDFPCFYMLYDNDELIAFLSVFIPDSASCEIYFHVCDRLKDTAYDIFSEIYTVAKEYLNDYLLYNRYILFDGKTSSLSNDNATIDMYFNHSECLMSYDPSYEFNVNSPVLTHIIENDINNITVTTYLDTTYIGICKVETQNQFALIHDVEILKNHRGLGYGTETLFHTIRHLIDNNYTRIYLHVNSANTIAFAMYSHHGFKIAQKIDYWKLNPQSS